MAKEETPSGGFSLNFGAGKSQPARKRFKISEADNAGRKELVTGIGEEGLVSTTQNAQQIPVAGNGQPRVIQNQGNDFRGLNGSRRKERYTSMICLIILEGVTVSTSFRDMTLLARHVLVQGSCYSFTHSALSLRSGMLSGPL